MSEIQLELAINMGPSSVWIYLFHNQILILTDYSWLETSYFAETQNCPFSINTQFGDKTDGPLLIISSLPADSVFYDEQTTIAALINQPSSNNI